MVEKQRPRSGSKFSLKPQIAAALSALLPLGYKAPPSLIGGKTTSHDVLALRVRNYVKAYKTLSVKDWNSYVAFGIQQFASPSKYLAIRDSESKHACNLRIGRYYRLHLEQKAPVDKFLMSQIVGIEAALQTAFPGYFDMSVVEMDEYLQTLSPEDFKNPDETLEVSSSPKKIDAEAHQDVDMANVALDADITDNIQESVKRTPSTHTPPSVPDVVSPMVLTKDGSSTPPTTQEFQATLRSIPLLEPDSHSIAGPTNARPRSKNAKKNVAHPQKTTPELKGPGKVTDTVRIEARWAPKDFHALKSSTAQMYIRLAPLLSTFNTSNSWMVEWQTDQLAPEQTISPSQLSKFLSIRMVTVLAQQCFYFSFRVNATGKQLVQVLQSKEHKKEKRGENLTLDPSAILVHQGEPVFIGDILLKDASLTHRSHYLKYLRSTVLPDDVPEFDLKSRHTDPTGNKTPILTVRCGKRVAIAVAQALSTFLNGDEKNPEIVISRLALGANQIAKGEHDKIYKVHHECLSDVAFIPFTVSRQIDFPVIEHLDSGEMVTRSPREWAKSLVDSDGNSLEVDLENGTTDGSAVLISPSASHQQTLMELHKYWQRQNPVIAKATKMYAATVLEDPDIPMTVFTRNIETILAKKIKKQSTSVPESDDAATFLSPESSITGTTSKSSKGPIAWKVPLQETMQRQEYHKASRKASRLHSKDLQQQQRIAHLEAQIASMSASNSKTSSTTEHHSKRSQSRASNTSSQLSGNSPTHTIASAHARLDGIETAVLSIQTMLTNMTARKSTNHTAGASPVQAPPSEWPSLSPTKVPAPMSGIQLFPVRGGESSTVALALLSTPTKKNSTKRRKPTASPDLRLQYNDSMGSSGEGSF